MKTLRILTMAVAALIWAACGNEDFLENNPGNEVAKPEFMTFTADGPQTRTQLAAGNKVYWTEYDEIALWDGSEAYQKLMVDAESIDGSRATFSGPAIPGADYTAFYPLVAVESMDATSVTFTLPAEQTAVAGTFANQLAPSLAKATGGSTNLVFENLCALVKFTVPADMAGEGTFTLVGGNATEALAGTLTCNTADGALTATEAATRITLKGLRERAGLLLRRASRHAGRRLQPALRRQQEQALPQGHRQLCDPHRRTHPQPGHAGIDRLRQGRHHGNGGR